MKSILQRLSAERLAWALGRNEIQAAARLVDVDVDNPGAWIADYAWNLHGPDLLRMSSVRELLIDMLGEDTPISF